MADKNINTLHFTKTTDLSFAGAPIPQPTEVISKSKDKPTPWGSNNKYAFFLLDLYSKSVIHGDIVDQKCVFLWGDGLMKVDDKKPFRIKPNDDDTFELFIEKILKNQVIFSAFAVEVNFNLDGTPNSYINIPIEKIGLADARKDKIFYYGEAGNRDKVTYVYERYDPKRVYTDLTPKVFYYEGYTPSYKNYVYPTPEYHKLINTLDTDIKIGDFSNNQITNHFSPSTMIDFFTGQDVDDDIKKKVLRDLEASYTGGQGKKIMVGFNNPNGTKTEIQNLSSGDWHDAFIALKDSIESLIYKGHGVPSSIFSDKNPGQLGNTQELLNAYEIWNNSYLRVRRTEIESALSDLFGVKIFFQNKPLFSTTIADDIKKSIYTINELRIEQGKEPIAGGDVFIGQFLAPVATSNFNSHSTCSHFGDEKDGNKLTYEDYEKIQHLGSISDDFEEVAGDVFSAQLRFDNQADIAQYIIDKEVTGVSSSELRALIKKDLGIDITTSGLKDLITDLSKAGVISATVDNGKFIIKPPVAQPKKEAVERTVMTMFKYVKREEVEGDELIATSREFCVKLCNSGKLYSNEDIKNMSIIFGRDIKKHTGGHWHDSNTGVTFNHCRHYFKALAVIKKQTS